MNYILTEEKQDAVTKKKYTNEEARKWLDEAIALDGAIVGAAPEIMQIIEELFPEILLKIQHQGKIKSFKATSSKGRIKYASKVILFNLYLAYLLGVPVGYSRDKKHYIAAKRYGKIYFKYQRIVPVVDSFKSLGLIKTMRGINYSKYKRTSRMWPSENLIQMFNKLPQHPLPLYSAERQEYIELRNSKKISVDYSESDDTKQLRANLDYYNKFISEQQVVVQIVGTQEINLHSLKQQLGELMKGKTTLNQLSLKINSNNNSTIIKEYTKHNHHPTNNNIISKEYNHKPCSVSITQSFFNNSADSIKKPTVRPENWFISRTTPLSQMKTTGDRIDESFSPVYVQGVPFRKANANLSNPLAYLTTLVRGELKRKQYSKRYLKEKRPLVDYNITNLSFTINNTKLYRVFNNSTFEEGGRFYGASYQMLSEELRTGILINGEPTIELDYAAHHVRMPYHLLGIDYREDPYLALTDDPDERKLMKKLLLIAMNAESEDNATKGFRGEMRDAVKRGSSILTDKNIKRMLQNARKIHSPIEQYIHSGAGKMLQNIDSRISEAILLKMTNSGIPCLAIHDSYIVPQEHQDKLLDAMMIEYERVMGFYPVIK